MKNHQHYAIQFAKLPGGYYSKELFYKVIESKKPA